MSEDRAMSHDPFVTGEKWLVDNWTAPLDGRQFFTYIRANEFAMKNLRAALDAAPRAATEPPDLYQRLTPEDEDFPTDTLAADLYTASSPMLRIVAEFLLDNGWTEPLDSEPRAPRAATEPLREALEFVLRAVHPIGGVYTDMPASNVEAVCETVRAALTPTSAPEPGS